MGEKTVWLKGKNGVVLVDPTVNLKKEAYNNCRILVYFGGENPELLEDKVVIAGAGEYEVGGIEVLGIADGGGGVVYVISMDGVEVVVLDELRGELSEKKVERLGEADVLTFSLGNIKTVGYKSIMKLAKSLGVNYLLPYGKDLASEEAKTFLDEADLEGFQAVESLKVGADDLPDGLETVILKSTQ